MKKWIMWLHIHTGLLFFGFLMIFGFSSVLFNHRPAYLEQRTPLVWDQAVSAQPQADLLKYAAAVADDLGISGRLLRTVAKNGDFDFVVSRPGRFYQVHLKDQKAHVKEERGGVVMTIADLHGVRPYGSSRLLIVWAWYAAIGAVVFAVSSFTGVYLWAIRRRERILGWVTLLGATIASLAICFFIWARG